MASHIKLILLIVFAALSLMVLQNAFDMSDHRKAERAVRNYTVNGNLLGPYLEKQAPGGNWSTEITHGCRGIVRATYDAPTAHYEFDYDVPGHIVHPGNEKGKEALAAFIAQPPAPASAPAPSGPSATPAPSEGNK